MADAILIRRRQSRRSVLVVDWLAGKVVTVGGLAVIAAVLLIFVYLASVVAPLFSPARIEAAAPLTLLDPKEAAQVFHLAVDEYGRLGAALSKSGELVTFETAGGKILDRRSLFPSTATAWTSSGPIAAVALADGSVRIVRIGFSAAFLAPDGAAASPDLRVDGAAVIERTAGGDRRRIATEIVVSDPILPLADDSAPEWCSIDARGDGDELRVALADRGGRWLLATVRTAENAITGERSSAVDSRVIEADLTLSRHGAPRFVRVSTSGDLAILAWADGTFARYDLRPDDVQRPVELGDLTDAELLGLDFANGEQSLLAVDSAGATDVWFRAEVGAGTADGYRLVRAHRLDRASAPVHAWSVSTRDKSIAVGDDAGAVRLVHLTSERLLARIDVGARVVAVRIAPKGDGVAILAADGRLHRPRVSAPHPETSLRSLFAKVWYEGYSEPSYTWQSSSGTDDFEPKLSLVPLVFGTLKATFFALLLAAPIALVAALATAELIDEKWRGPVKSTVELMASLPSVVLGFIAALVLAPQVEHGVFGILLAIATLPPILLVIGAAWSTTLGRGRRREDRRSPLLLSLAVVPLVFATSIALAPRLERLLFAGDFRAWLGGGPGSPAPILAFLIWPLAFATALISLRSRPARSEIRALMTALAIALAGATGGGFLLARAGFDPRGTLVDTYVQRNALVVSFVMGFAVIPIIYTIAEDALAAVPRSLRSASIGCGASRWQTAVRIVLPTAAPGIFSTLMVGLGRAVGETMIVLMAAGNTPILDLNPFNGLRTLSANIAVELPEAVREGTLYRVLFLAALVLFVVTFAINTLAELVRQRFRRRAAAL